MLPYIAYMDPHLNMSDDSGPSWHVSQCSCAPQIEKRIVLLVYDMASSFQPISKIIMEEGRFSQTSLKWNIFNSSYSIYFRIILSVDDFVCIMYYSLYLCVYIYIHVYVRHIHSIEQITCDDINIKSWVFTLTL